MENARQGEAPFGLIPSGVLKGRPFLHRPLNVGEMCEICEKPCPYGNCLRCGGHSEHNYGCDTLWPS